MKISCNFKSIIVAGLLLATTGGASLFAQDTNTGYVISDELAARDEAGFLQGVSDEVAANPDQAAEIVKAALQLRLQEIEKNPGLATSIVQAALAGLQGDARTPNAIADLLDAAVSVLKSLPVDQSNVAQDVVQGVLAGLDPDLAEAVKASLLQGPEGGLRDSAAFIFTVPPTGGNAEAGPNEKVTICHKGKNTLSVSINALNAHLAHGDTMGPCQVTPDQ